MRKKVEILERPSLAVHIDYDHLTVGELGNILIRLQAGLRGIAGLSPGEYDGRYYREQPRFIASSVSTEKSIDILSILAVLAGVLQAPRALNDWKRFTTEVFRRFKIAIAALVQGEIRSQGNDFNIEGLRVEVTKGKIDIEASRSFLNELTTRQKRTLANFLWSLTGPANRVDIGDEEFEISIEWPDKDNDKK